MGSPPASSTGHARPSVRRAARLGAVAAVLSGVVLALLGLPHLFRAAPLRLVVSPGDSAGLPSIGDGRFTVAVAALAGVGLEPSPTGQVLTDGGGTFPVLYQDLRSARRSITMQVYYKSGGAVADSVRRILVERARAGVSVHFMHDAFGSEALPTHYSDALRAAGVRVATFRPFRWYELDRVGHRSHTRAIVIDGRVGYTGGYGLDDKWLGSGRRPGEWRETNVRITGHAVRQLQAAFVEEWAEATGELLTGSLLFPEMDGPPAEAGAGVPALSGVVHSIPSAGTSPAERLLALSIVGARRTLFISNAYFLPNASFRRLLADAARRGVDVRVLTNGAEIDIGLARLASRARYEELLAAGIRIFEYQPSMMHAKTFVADGVWAGIGTANFDNRSLALNNEVMYVALDPALGVVMDSLFTADIAFAREIQLSEFRRRPWTERVRERAAALLERLL